MYKSPTCTNVLFPWGYLKSKILIIPTNLKKISKKKISQKFSETSHSVNKSTIKTTDKILEDIISKEINLQWLFIFTKQSLWLNLTISFFLLFRKRLLGTSNLFLSFKFLVYSLCTFLYFLSGFICIIVLPFFSNRWFA